MQEFFSANSSDDLCLVFWINPSSIYACVYVCVSVTLPQVYLSGSLLYINSVEQLQCDGLLGRSQQLYQNE